MGILTEQDLTDMYDEMLRQLYRCTINICGTKVDQVTAYKKSNSKHYWDGRSYYIQGLLKDKVIESIDGQVVLI